jgi:hypothetical protein
MSTIPSSSLLVAAQVYGGPAQAHRREASGGQSFAAELKPRETAKRPVNPTLAAPQGPQKLEPARRHDEGAGRRDAVTVQTAAPAARLERPGARLDIRV